MKEKKLNQVWQLKKKNKTKKEMDYLQLSIQYLLVNWPYWYNK